jgi:hypothetical protein
LLSTGYVVKLVALNGFLRSCKIHFLHVASRPNIIRLLEII